MVSATTSAPRTASSAVRTARARGSVGGDALGVLVASRRDADLVEVAHERQCPQVVRALHAGADDRQHARVRARQQVQLSAAAALVRIAVMYVPSRNARHSPVSPS